MTPYLTKRLQRVKIIFLTPLAVVLTPTFADTDLAPIYANKHGTRPSPYYQVTAAGPIIEKHLDEQHTFQAVRPLATQVKDSDTSELHILYPLFSKKQGKKTTRWNAFNLLQASHVQHGAGENTTKVFAYPFFFYNKSFNPKNSYSGIFPLGGEMHHFLGVDKVTWSYFPLFLKLERRGVQKTSLPWPFISWQSGQGAGGFALWPLYGNFYKENDYKHQYILWPFIYNNKDNLGTNNPRTKHAFLPFYAYEKSNNRQVSTVLWPFFSKISEKNPDYTERQFPWPLFVQGRGKNQYVNRWAPFYTHSIRGGVEKKWLLWPLFKNRKWQEKGNAIEQTQFLYVLYWKQEQKSLTNPNAKPASKSHVWPLYSAWDDGAGRKQFQMLSPFEVFFPTNKVVRNLYSPLFALYQYDQIAPGCRSQSFLFGLIKEEKTPEHSSFSLGPLFKTYKSQYTKKWQILGGLIGSETTPHKKTFKFLGFSL